MKKLIMLLIFLMIGFTIYLHMDPLDYVMPVVGATKKSYNQQSFWAYPWGTSGHHKGVDIFAKKHTPVVSATRGIVVFNGVLSKGGNVLLVFGPNLRLHYYAHLDKFSTGLFRIVNAGDTIGTVGNTGNAAGKPPHLHYSISRIIPRLGGNEELVKRFYDDPVFYLNEAVKK